jgi:hypothetical protein
MRVVGVFLIVAAVLVAAAGGAATLFCMPEDVTGCSQTGTFAVLTIGSVGLLGAAAWSCFRLARGPSPVAKALLIGIAALVAIAAIGTFLAILLAEPPAPPEIPNPIPTA